MGPAFANVRTWAPMRLYHGDNMKPNAMKQRIDELGALRLAINTLKTREEFLADLVKAKGGGTGDKFQATLVKQPARTIKIPAHEQLRVTMLGPTINPTTTTVRVKNKELLKELHRLNRAEINCAYPKDVVDLLDKVRLTNAKSGIYHAGFNGVVEQPVTVYKKLHNGFIATLELSVGTRITYSGCNSKKMRANKAKVLRIEQMDSRITINKGRAKYDRSFEYEVGKIVRPKNGYNSDVMSDCAPGIHFFTDAAKARKF